MSTGGSELTAEKDLTNDDINVSFKLHPNSKTMRKILIQLIGGQTLPNIFPVIAVQPDRVVNIYTQDTEKKHKKIKNWFKTYGEEFNVAAEFAEYTPIPTDINDVYASIKHIMTKEMEFALEQKDTMVILNITGGLKSMTICSLLLRMGISNQLEKAGCPPVPVLYLNPKSREIEFASGGDRAKEVVLRDVKDIKLKVKHLVEASGDIVVLGSRKNWADIYVAAEQLRELADKKICFAMSEIQMKKNGDDAAKPLSALLVNKYGAGDLAASVAAFKELAVRAEGDEYLRNAFELCGLAVRDGDFYLGDKLQRSVEQCLEEIKNNETLSNYHKMKKMREVEYEIQDALNFFVGGWWEVIVAAAYRKSNPSVEVLWSVRTAPLYDQDHAAETDIIASDGYALCCISCKRGVHKNVTQELEQHCTRTDVLGGNVNRRIVAFYDRRANVLKTLLKALGLEMWDSRTVRKLLKGQPIDDSNDASEEVSVVAADSGEEPVSAEPTEAMPFMKRLATAARLIFTGKM